MLQKLTFIFLSLTLITSFPTRAAEINEEQVIQELSTCAGSLGELENSSSDYSQYCAEVKSVYEENFEVQNPVLQRLFSTKAECSSNLGCSLGQICVKKKCVNKHGSSNKCSTNIDCPTFYKCVEGQCVR